MAGPLRRARDLSLLDAIDAFAREALSLKVWRVVRGARDPTLGAASRSRWCNGEFDVLYTSLSRDCAIAEIDALLSIQPVPPSKGQWVAYELSVTAQKVLRLADLTTLAKLGVDISRYRERDYTKTQDIADAAYFLGFDGLIAPSARWSDLNLMIFTDRLLPANIEISAMSNEPIAWEAWRRARREAPRR